MRVVLPMPYVRLRDTCLMCYNARYESPPMGTGRLELPRRSASKLQTCHVCLFHHVPVSDAGSREVLTGATCSLIYSQDYHHGRPMSTVSRYYAQQLRFE